MVQTDHRALRKAGTTLHLEHELTGCRWDATLPRSMADLPVRKPSAGHERCEQSTATVQDRQFQLQGYGTHIVRFEAKT